MSRIRRKRGARVETPAGARPPLGGRFMPLTDADCDQVIETSFAILDRIGLADAPPEIRRLALENGAAERADGRLTFSRALVNEMIARASKRVELPGFDPARGIEVGGGRVHVGTGGAAVQVLDGATGQFRDSTLSDLYGLMRIVDACENIHYSLRPVVARDMVDHRTLDINTAFAALKATSKPIGTSFFEPGNVAPVVEMLDAALGGNLLCRATLLLRLDLPCGAATDLGRGGMRRYARMCPPWHAAADLLGSAGWRNQPGGAGRCAGPGVGGIAGRAGACQHDAARAFPASWPSCPSSRTCAPAP